MGEILYTPGHTPADVTYKIDDAAFVGDTLFMPDFGTARADFPGGVRTGCIARSGGSWRYRRRRGYSCVTTTRRPVATNTPGKRRCARSARTTSTSKRASARCLRRRAHGARRHAHRAAALVAVNPGQHRAGHFSAGGRQRRALSDDSGEVQESRSRALKAAVASTAPSRCARRRPLQPRFRGYRRCPTIHHSSQPVRLPSLRKVWR